MALHNTVRDVNYAPSFLSEQIGFEKYQQLTSVLPSKLAPMTHLDGIDDSVGGWYHTSGPAALSLMQGGSWLADWMSTGDEQVWRGQRPSCSGVTTELRTEPVWM